MKKLILYLLAFTPLFIVGCNDDPINPSPSPGPNVVMITNDINSPTVWDADSIYVISDHDFWVEAALTIQPGTIIKFSTNGQYMSIGASGTVIALGTVDKPIIFTSVKDDSHGGDTNVDGGATVPLAGDWGQVTCESNSNLFKYCEFYYGGGSSYYTTLKIESLNCQVTYCTFAYNSGGKMGDFYYGALDATSAGTTTVIKSNVFYKNNIPLSISSLIDIDNSNTFKNPLLTTEKNTMNGIFVYDSGGIAEPVYWAETEVPFVIHDNDLWIESGGSLTLATGVILKFTPYSTIVVATGATINNYLNCAFTSFKDDTRGGDTNGDATATTPASSDWNGIYSDVSSVYYTWSTIYFDSH